MPTFPYSWYNLADKAYGRLATAITATASVCSLGAGEGIRFPASDFIVKMDDEDVHVSTRSTDTFSGLTRGYGNTSAVSHGAGALVILPGGKSLWQRLYDNLTGHTHPKADIPDFSHNHAQGDVTNLVSDLASKQNTSEKGQANGYASLDGSGRVPAAQLPPGGSDPWTVVVRTADFTASAAAAVDVTGLSFTPAANTRYMFEALLLTRTATATVGPRPGVAWPSGMTDGAASIQQTSSATANVFANGNISAAVLAPVGGVPTTTGSWPAFIFGSVVAGASPSGTVRVQLASETAGTNVLVKAGSYLRYRSY